METKELQRKSVDFAEEFNRKTGRRVDDSVTMIHLTEEVGEIAAEIFNEKSGRATLNKEHLGDEIADVFIILSELGKFYTIDIEGAVLKKMEKDSKRFRD